MFFIVNFLFNVIHSIIALLLYSVNLYYWKYIINNAIIFFSYIVFSFLSKVIIYEEKNRYFYNWMVQ